MRTHIHFVNVELEASERERYLERVDAVLRRFSDRIETIRVRIGDQFVSAFENFRDCPDAFDIGIWVAAHLCFAEAVLTGGRRVEVEAWGFHPREALEAGLRRVRRRVGRELTRRAADNRRRTPLGVASMDAP